MPRPAIYGFARGNFNFYLPLPAGAGLVAAVSALVPGFEFTIEKVTFFTQVVGVGAGASRVFRVLKNTATVVATATLLLAETDTIGELKAFTVTAADAFYSDTDSLTVDFPAAGAVAFTAGAGILVVTYRHQLQRIR